MKILETTRQTLHELSLDDASFMLELLNTPGWIQFIGDRGVKTIEEARNYLQNGYLKSYRQHGFGFYLQRLKSNQAKIGICGLIKRDSLSDVDIGFGMLPGYEGKGYALEAAKAVLEYARTNLHIPRIIAITTPDNRRSIRLLEKLGLQFESQMEYGDAKEVLNVYAIDFTTS